MLPSEIWHVKGKNQDGPNVVILGGTHGDELTGIALVKRVMRALGISEAPSSESFEQDTVVGNLFLGFGNPEAIAQNMRYADQSRKQDLNRCFVSELLAQPPAEDFADLKRARELVPLFTETDLLIDIHATSEMSPPFVCFAYEAPGHRDLCRHIPTTHIVMDNNFVLGGDQPDVYRTATTDSYVLAHGGSPWSVKRFGKKRALALCYETGQQVDFTRVDPVLSVVLRLLLEFGSVTPFFAETVGLAPSIVASDPLYCDLKQLVKAKHTEFDFADGMLEPWKEVRQGDLIGTYPNGEVERCPCDGLLVFPKAKNQIEVGKSLYFVMVPHIV